MTSSWDGIPYITIGEHYHQRFGGKVYKIPVSVVDDCPNRRGLKGMQTCVFCDVWGSAARTETMVLPLREQIEKVQGLLHRKYKPRHYLVYFQAYTNTFTKVSALRANFETALSYDFVKGLVIGTRPDCLSPAVMQLWQEFHERSFVAVELGVQSFDDGQLAFMRRGHTARESLAAIEKISKNTSVDLGIHLIFGNPGETDEQMIETAKICNDLPITNVKLHNLHVLKNTPLEEMHKQGLFTPVELETYARRVRLFLEHLSPRLAVHRLAAYSSRWEELIAPRWTSDKMGSHQKILMALKKEGGYQGRLWNGSGAEEIQQKIKLQNRLVAKSSSPRSSTNSSTDTRQII
ncbi:MAG: TIGR01212 family radical SAM protein [Bdellovibrionaceae bacterium]|nr:TIGR01212 family radical SAM protein [Pseudobdellovibrionaceae bacterium]